MENKGEKDFGTTSRLTKAQIEAGKTRGKRVFLITGILMSALMFFAIYDMYQKENISGAKTFFVAWLGTFFMFVYIIVLFSKRIERVLSKNPLPKDGNEYGKALRRSGLKFRWHILIATGCAVSIVLVFSELFM